MAGKIKTMSQIKQFLIMNNQGLSKKAIARALNRSKNTVKSYLLKLDLLVRYHQAKKDSAEIKSRNPYNICGD